MINNVVNVLQVGKLALQYGGTNADLSATGGTSQVLKQVSSGANVTVAQLAASDLSDYITDSYVPIATNLTQTGGAATITGHYTRIGNLVFFQIKIQPAGGGSTSCASSTTYFSVPPCGGAVRITPCCASDQVVINLGTGFSANVIYPPTWTLDTFNVYISGTYELA